MNATLAAMPTLKPLSGSLSRPVRNPELTWCEHAGRVRVERKRVEVWLIDFANLASAGAKALGLGDSPRAIVDGRIWLLGTRCFGDRTRDVFLVRGATWPDGCQLLADTVRLVTSPCPLILAPNLVPGDPTWTSNGRVVLSMSEFQWFDGDPQAVLREITDILREHDRGTTPVVDHVFRREGQYWTITFAGKTIRMRASKGMLYLSYVLSGPGREFPAVELLAAAEGAQPSPVRSSAGEILDPKAMVQYKTRATEIASEIEEARGNNDFGRVERLQGELESLADQISAAKGLGGRRRTVGDSNERARKAVGQAVTRAIEQIRKNHTSLAQHLNKHISLGTSLSYGGGAPWIS